MHYLHSQQPPIIHGGIISTNIMMDNTGRIRITDYGFSTMRPLGEDLEGIIGTPVTLAPEIFRGQPFSTHSDVYSYGMLLYEMMTKSLPFTELSFDRLAHTVRTRHDDVIIILIRFQILKQGKRPTIPTKVHVVPKCDDVI